MSDHQNPNDEISKAVMALQELPVLEGPSGETISRTLAALREAAEKSTKRPLLRPLDSARWVVNAAVALAIAAVVLVMCLVLSGSGSVAFAQVAEKLRAAATFSFDATLIPTGQRQPTLKYRMLYMDHGKMRIETPHVITIMDQKTGASLALSDITKTAIVTPAKPIETSPIRDLPNQIDVLRNMADKSSHPLGEKEIDGQKAKGFICDVKSDLQYTIWVNATTGDLIRVEFPLTVGPVQGIMTMTNFKLNEQLDPTLFSTDVPKGYKVIENAPLDNKILYVTPAENVVEILRAYAEKSDGEFPKRLDDWGAFSTKLSHGIDPTNADAMKSMTTTMQRIGALSGGYLFSHKKGSDYDYLPGGKLGEKDRIVFWYKYDKTSDYRAVYGDLRIEKINQEQLPPPTANEAPNADETPRNPAVEIHKSQ